MRFTLHSNWSRLLLFAPLLACSPLLAQPETVVPNGAIWRFRKGTTEASSPITLWRGSAFDDSSWTPAPAPFHYGEGLSTGTLLSDMRGLYTCIFLRRSFVVTNVEEATALRLTAMDDDGFIAWINGAEVFRARVSGQPAFNGIASGSHEALPAEIFTDNTPGAYLVRGTNVLAVQAFNRDLSASTDFRFEAQLEIIKTDLLLLIWRVYPLHRVRPSRLSRKSPSFSANRSMASMPRISKSTARSPAVSSGIPAPVPTRSHLPSLFLVRWPWNGTMPRVSSTRQATCLIHPARDWIGLTPSPIRSLRKLQS